ncbi:MAG: CvpA family protein [Chloroflexi bacterium]|nr:CvpA family protein [Chloroflexota bacterium]MBT4072546.1 CvpA family protein [Chloroflexota bacterium]MBT4514726.1 CvpA family protein [Chloroflexota bacterium]MBT6682189.1 CvpA family protein [Chloroflexota bacterium]
MSILDWVLVAVFVVGALLGLKWGLVQAVLNFVAVYVAMLVGAQFADGLVERFTDDIENESVTTAIGYVVIFLGVFIVAQIVGKIIRAMLSMVFLGWVDKLGGVVVGVLLGAILVTGVVTAMARVAYPQDEAILADISDIASISGGIDVDAAKERLYQELAERYGRDTIKEWLADSTMVPKVLDAREKLPANVLGLIPGEFASALNTLEADLADNVDG